MNRYFIKNNLENGSIVYLEGDELHHLNVMRKKVGDAVEIINGNGADANGKVIEIGKNKASIQLENVETLPPSNKIIIAQSIPRMNRLDYILEKGTELGMSEIWLFPGKNSEKKTISNQQQKRMERITISALKQCGSAYLPKIVIKPPLQKWDKLDGQLLFGDISKNAPPIKNLEKTKQIVFFIGPEKGFDRSEIEKLKELGAHGVKLHKNILRTDTAPIVALSIMQHLLSS